MPTKTLKMFAARSRQEWRKWLARHHDAEPGVWLLFNKRRTGRPSVRYDAAVEKALCFGWIDSIIRRVDDSRYARKFTPRRTDSRWSTANRHRYADLAARGRLTPAGARCAPTGRSGDAPRPPDVLPRYIETALRSTPAAWHHFERLARSYRRMYVGWIDSAKRPETKQRRLREAVRLLAAGEKLGLR
jgi:uncharacterized protein YdeI (YjbR/CyaY-like superfamily)